MIHHQGLRMDKSPALERLDGIVALVARLGTATAAQIEEGMMLKRRMAGLYIAYLCSVDRLALHQRHNSGGNARTGSKAIYKLGAAANVPPPEAEPFEGQRMVGANDWPRGEHAHRTGLLAAFFPLAQK